MTGMIQGGWGYVIAVYGISWGVLLGFALVALRGSRPAALAALDPGTDPNAGSDA